MKKVIAVLLAPAFLAGCFGSEPGAAETPVTPEAATTKTPQGSSVPQATPAAVVQPAGALSQENFVELMAAFMCMAKEQPTATQEQYSQALSALAQKYGATEQNITEFRKNLKEEDKKQLQLKILGRADEVCAISKK